VLVVFDPADDSPVRIDKARYACIGAAYNTYPIFNCPHDTHGKKLIGSCGFTKPGLVGDIDNEIGSSLYKLSDKIRKEILPANGNTKSSLGVGKNFKLLARHITTDLRDTDKRPGKNIFQRQIFSKRKQSDFVVMLTFTFWLDQKSRIVVFRLLGVFAIIALIIFVISLITSLMTGNHAPNSPSTPFSSIWLQIAIVAKGLIVASILSLIPTIAAKIAGVTNRIKLSATEIFLFAIAIVSIASILVGLKNNIGWISFAVFTIAFLDIGAHLIDWIRESTFRRVDKTWQYKSLREDTASFDKLYNFERILYAAIPLGIVLGTFIGVIQKLTEIEIALLSVRAITLFAFLILVFITFKSFKLMIVPMYNLTNPPAQRAIFTGKQREGAKSKEEKSLSLAIMSTDLRKLYLYDSTHNILLMFLFAYSFLLTYGRIIELKFLVIAIMLATIMFSQFPYVLGQYFLHQKTLEPFEGLPRAEVEEKIRKYAPLYPTFHFLGALLTSGTAGGLAYFLLDNFVKGLFK